MNPTHLMHTLTRPRTTGPATPQPPGVRALVPAMVLAAASLLGAASARAHVTLAPAQATAGSYAKLVFTVPHGCGSRPTRAVTVHLPPGFLAARPMVKPGWTVTLTRSRLVPPPLLHGKPLEDTPSVVRWEGGPLPADAFDEFALLGKLDERVGAGGSSLAFRVVQTCDQGELDWSGPPGSETPAPRLEVTPAGVPTAVPAGMSAGASGSAASGAAQAHQH